MNDSLEVIWEPAQDWRSTSQIGHFLDFLQRTRGIDFEDYQQLWEWSTSDLEGFWGALWEHFGVISDAPHSCVIQDRSMPGATWFPGARLNYVRQLLAPSEYDDQVAVIGVSQTRAELTWTFAELRAEVARVSHGLARLGVKPGDRVVGYLPNIPETLVAFLATAALGAVWAGCAPEFGARSVVDRFAQLEPTVLLAVSGYRFGAKYVDRIEQVAEIRAELPTVRSVIEVSYGELSIPDSVAWDQLGADSGTPEIDYLPVAFDHPLFILFSSGTTGIPKAIIHGHGGILVEHLKNHALSWDLGPGDRMLWFSTTAWMLWNALVSSLLLKTSIVTVDGNPAYPDLDAQWALAARTQATVMGVSPGFLMASRKAALTPTRSHDLSRIKQLGAAGSPLTEEGFRWVAEQFPGILLNVGSGGTDVCSGIVQGCPMLPVVVGEIAGKCLGVAVYAFDPEGNSVVGDLGELVITAPMPSMPVGFWGDPGDARYRAAYFEAYPGVWRHGDWIRFSGSGTSIITGRSDATLNRGGVRLGTAEFYRVVEEFAEVEDSLVVHLEDPEGGNGELLLFVALAAGHALDEPLNGRLRGALRTELSPRHVPDVILAVPSIPRTRTGKKLELPVKKILLGAPTHEVATADALLDSTSLTSIAELYRRRSEQPGATEK